MKSTNELQAKEEVSSTIFGISRAVISMIFFVVMCVCLFLAYEKTDVVYLLSGIVALAISLVSALID